MEHNLGSVFIEVAPEVAAEEASVVSKDSVGSDSIVLSVLMVRWLGSELLEMYPHYLVTRRLADALSTSNLSGFQIGECQVSYSTEFHGRVLTAFMKPPELAWLRVTGAFLKTDIAISPNKRLILSQRAIALFMQFNMFGLTLCQEFHADSGS